MRNPIFLDEIDFSSISLHRVGNRSRDEGIRAAKKPLDLKEDDKDILFQYFLSEFKTEKLYQFNHEHDLSMNETYETIGKMFEGDYWAHAGSIELLQNLYNKSNHVKVKGGELYVCLIDGIVYDDEIVQGVGIFKAEDKETFLKLKLDEQEEWTIDFQEGNSTSKIDKGCIVLNVECETGYRILHLDKKSADAKFFMDDFLGITEVKDERYHTRIYLELCKSFADRFYKEHSKLQKAHFLQSCKDYFENYKEFNFEELRSVIFNTQSRGCSEYSQLEASDKLFDELQDYQESELIEEEFDEEFLIDKKEAVAAGKKLKPIIKLDTQMEIKIQSSQCYEEGLIEEGFDEKKEMKYFKIYYNNAK